MIKILITLLLAVSISVVQASTVIQSHALYQYGTSEYLEQQDIDQPHSIASITKLFTAITVLESHQDLNELIDINCENRGHVQRGMTMTRSDLLTAMIVSSDNCAAETLANSYVGGVDQFKGARSRIIDQLGLKNTHLIDATGLSMFNVSTVEDLVAFAPVAYSNEVLRSIANLRQATLTAYKKKRKITITVHNTNPAVYTHPEVVVSKTGFTNAAGRCVLMLVQHVQDFYAVVVLGEPNVKSRTKRVEKLLATNF